MIDEIGTVVELKKGQVAMVHCRKSSACRGCPSANFCSLGHDDGDRQVEVHNSLGAQVGEQVRIATTTKAFYQSSFLIYIVPLIGLVLGALIGQNLGQRMQVDPNIPSCLVGVLFLVMTFLGIRQLNRHLSKEDYMPTVVEILQEEEGGNAGCAENL